MQSTKKRPPIRVYSPDRNPDSDLDSLRFTARFLVGACCFGLLLSAALGFAGCCHG